MLTAWPQHLARLWSEMLTVQLVAECHLHNHDRHSLGSFADRRLRMLTTAIARAPTNKTKTYAFAHRVRICTCGFLATYCRTVYGLLVIRMFHYVES